MKLVKTPVAVALILLSGCGAMSTLDPNEATISDKASIVILGVQPRFRIGVSAGNGLTQTWRPTSGFHANAFPEDGYLVLKLTPTKEGASYGVTQVLTKDFGLAIPPRYTACTGRATAAFEAPAGKVIYVGDLEYEVKGDSLRFSYGKSPERLREMLGKKYPALADKWESGEIYFPTVENLDCGPLHGTIPVFIPGRK